MKIPLLLSLTLGAGCAPEEASGPQQGGLSPLKAPTIVDHTIRCDVDKAEWEVEVLTDAWTSGGKIHWTVDGTYVEKKTIPSLAAAEDGSWDQLQASFDVVDNWRKAGAKSTAFGCTEDVASLLIIFDMDGQRSDCIDEADDDLLWASVGVTPCEAISTTP